MKRILPENEFKKQSYYDFRPEERRTEAKKENKGMFGMFD